MKPSISYLAGAVDADGCISIYRKAYRRKGTDKVVIYYEPRISFGQITEQIPKLLHERFGGYLYTHFPKRLNSKPYHQWMMSNSQCSHPLKTLKPYLILKREQAVVAIEMCSMVGKRTNARSLVQISSDEEIIRHKLWQRMDALNCNGRRRIYGFNSEGIRVSSSQVE